MKTNITKIILWIIIALLLWAIIFYPKQNECFDRLEVIQERLKELEQLKQDTQSQINQHEMDITTLKQVMEQLEYEESNLNSEALNLFNWFLWKPDSDYEELDLITDEEWNFIWWIWNWTWEREPGQLTEDWTNQVMPPITWDSSHEKFKSLANAYGLNPSAIREVENHYGITESTILCIMIAETSWWHKGYGTWTCNNVWNVYNTDSWNRKCFDSYTEWLEAIWQTLNNKYLWNIKTLWCLSNWWSCKDWDNNSHRYATSDWNWERNMVACLSTVYWEIDPATFIIRK